MAFRANQGFSTWIGGARRRFAKDAVVPDEIASEAPALVYDDGVPAQPRRRSAKAAPSTIDE